MGLFDFFKKTEEPQKPALPIIHDITLGRTVVVDELAIQLLGPNHRLKLTTPTLTITGQGTVEFEDGVWLHRFYTDDHVLLQIMGGDGVEDKSVQQVSIFWAYDSINPANKIMLNQELDRMKKATYELDGETYHRIWFDGEGNADLVQFYEAVNLETDGSDKYGIQQSCMLFARDVGEHEESLLVTYEKTDQGDECISLMVGAVLSLNDITL